MAKVVKPNRESYVEALIQTAEEILLRAEEIVGDIDGQKNVYVSFTIEPWSVTELNVCKTFICGSKKIVFKEGARHDTTKKATTDA